MCISADVAELVDALASGASALRGVEVQVLSSVPTSSYPNPPQLKQAEMRFQMLNNAHPPGWALFVLWSSWAHRQRWAVWLRRQAEIGFAGDVHGQQMGCEILQASRKLSATIEKGDLTCKKLQHYITLPSPLTTV